MEEQKIDLNSLVVIEQLPKIRETLGVISDEIDKEIETALALDCTEESKTEVKKYRANLNKIKTELEERRKSVKEQIMAPYEQFQAIYDDLVKNKLVEADKTLKERIDAIENTQKEEKKQTLLNFVDEYIRFYHLEDWFQGEKLLPDITLSKSEKSLKEEIKGQIEGIAKTIELIKNEDFADEVLVEYLENLDYTKSKLDVINRHKKQEAIGSALFVDNGNGYELLNETLKEEPEEITVPKEIVEEELIECTFTVNATKEQLLQIKEFLKEMKIQYE